MAKMKYNPLTGQMEMSDVTTEDIFINDEAPLSINKSYWPKEWFNSNNMPFIPAGQTLESILKELFVQTLDGRVVWGIDDLKCNSQDSQFNYTPIIECGGSWSLISDKSATLEDIRISATLLHSLGYFLSPDGQWRDDELVVNVPVVLEGKSILYKGNGSTMTRDAGHWVNYTSSLQGNQFNAFLAISEENTYYFSVKSAVYHPVVYASNNKKRIQRDIFAQLDNNSIPAEKLSPRTYIKTRKIYNSYYYFAGIVQDSLEYMLSGDIHNLPIKDFIHQYDKDADSVYLPYYIDLPVILPTGKSFVIFTPPGFLAKSNIGFEQIEQTEFPYTLPDGSSVNYTKYEFLNPSSTDLEFIIRILSQ